MKRQYRRSRRTAMPMLLILILLSVPSVFSQNRVLHVTFSEKNLPVMTDITRRSMAVELERAGLSVESREAYLPGTMTDREVQTLAESVNAQYVAALRFESDGSTADLAMALYDTQSGDSLAGEEISGIPLGLEFDTIVVDTTRKLISDAGIRFHQAAPTGSGEADTSPQPRPVGLPVGGISPGQAVAPVQEEPVGIPVTLSFGMAPVLVTGQTSDFLKFGGMTTVAGNYRFRGGPVDLEIGLTGGFLRLFPERPTSITNVDLVPLGISARGETSSVLPVSFGITAAGGAALLSVGGTQQGSVTKTIPYVLAGIDVAWYLPRSLVLRISSDYITFFEQEYPIMAFVPAVSMAWRF